jgi:cell division protein FtsB
VAARARRRRQANARARHPASKTPLNRKPPSPRVRRRRATLATILLGLAVVGLLFAFVYPTSTYLRQRSELGAAQRRLDRLQSETLRLEEANKKLQSDAEVERIAREQYGLVRPGETPYVLVPAASTTTTTTTKPQGKNTNKQP